MWKDHPARRIQSAGYGQPGAWSGAPAGNLDEEFSVEPVIPEGAFTTTATLREFIDEYNASLPALLSLTISKRCWKNTTPPCRRRCRWVHRWKKQLRATWRCQLSSSVSRQTRSRPQRDEGLHQRVQRHPAAQVKTSGSRDALLEQLAIINPDLVAQEAQKPVPLKVSGTKADMIQAVKSVNPDAVFADELLDAWRENPDEKILVTRQQLDRAGYSESPSGAPDRRDVAPASEPRR
jgi:exodeoxyribonuclease VIII